MMGRRFRSRHVQRFAAKEEEDTRDFISKEREVLRAGNCLSQADILFTSDLVQYRYRCLQEFRVIVRDRIANINCDISGRT